MHGFKYMLENPLLHVGIQLRRLRTWDTSFILNMWMKKMVIIAFSQDRMGCRFGLMNVEPFSTQQETMIKEDLKILKWFTNFEEFVVNHQEYPEERKSRQ